MLATEKLLGFSTPDPDTRECLQNHGYGECRRIGVGRERSFPLGRFQKLSLARYALCCVTGEAVASLALGVQPDRTAIVRFPIASAPGVFDLAGLGEVDANVFDVVFTEHVGLK